MNPLGNQFKDIRNRYQGTTMGQINEVLEFQIIDLICDRPSSQLWMQIRDHLRDELE